MAVLQSKGKYKLPNIEYKLGKYKNRMELIRTAIGVVVLVFQVIIVYNLLTK
jgi:hypothetical protein